MTSTNSPRLDERQESTRRCAPQLFVCGEDGRSDCTEPDNEMNRTPILFLNVLIIATCGLIYELLAGTLASYVLGDSVTQFSLIIGIYLSALGVGAWLSRFIETGLARAFHRGRAGGGGAVEGGRRRCSS